jgi:hypothetical protein
VTKLYKDDERFVRVMVNSGDEEPTPMWGLAKTSLVSMEIIRFCPVYCADPETITNEFGKYTDSDGYLGSLLPEEMRSVVEADENNTPDEAWVALAKWKLTQ